MRPGLDMERDSGKLGGMQYRTLGSTGLKVSLLGFGAMRLPMKKTERGDVVDRDLAIPMIHEAFKAGVNYIDTAVGYCNSDSQRAVGEALQGWRDRIIVSTKNPYYGDSEAEWRKNLEDSLERLRVDRIDIYNHHGIRWSTYQDAIEPRLGKWMRKARDEGLIGHICVSFHDGNEALRKVVDTGYPEVITLQYNMLDRSLEDGIAYAHSRGIGIVVMGPVGGGRLGYATDVMKSMVPGSAAMPELALRFVFSNPNISAAISGMSTMDQVRENLATASDGKTLSDGDRKRLEEHLGKLRALADLYCTGCGYCKPCPKNVDIPGIFDAYNQGRVYGYWQRAHDWYAWYSSDSSRGTAETCAECGECEKKCPQKIPVIKQLKEAHAALKAAHQ